jgi:hypothetical protein
MAKINNEWGEPVAIDYELYGAILARCYIGPDTGGDEYRTTVASESFFYKFIR